MTGHDRHGIIAFRLKALEQEATGDVLMISDRFAWPYSAFPSKGKPPRREYDTESQLLSIRFVSADRDTIRGTMDPYWDPDRDCLASTSFLGSVDGDVIRGTSAPSARTESVRCGAAGGSNAGARARGGDASHTIPPPGAR